MDSTTFNAADSAYAAGITVKRLRAIAASRRLGMRRPLGFSHADIYTLALYEALRVAGVAPSRLGIVASAPVELAQLHTSSLACVLAGMSLGIDAGNDRLCTIDLGGISRGIEIRLADVRKIRNGTAQ